MVQADTPTFRRVEAANAPETDDAIILGGGAAGLMCAAVASQRGRRVRVLERAERIGKKILVSGGGRCNFTNLHAGPENYLSAQPGFCRSALARYRPEDFVALVERHGVEALARQQREAGGAPVGHHDLVALAAQRPLHESAQRGIVVDVEKPRWISLQGRPHPAPSGTWMTERNRPSWRMASAKAS